MGCAVDSSAADWCVATVNVPTMVVAPGCVVASTGVGDEVIAKTHVSHRNRHVAFTIRPMPLSAMHKPLRSGKQNSALSGRLQGSCAGVCVVGCGVGTHVPQRTLHAALTILPMAPLALQNCLRDSRHSAVLPGMPLQSSCVVGVGSVATTVVGSAGTATANVVVVFNLLVVVDADTLVTVDRGTLLAVSRDGQHVVGHKRAINISPHLKPVRNTVLQFSESGKQADVCTAFVVAVSPSNDTVDACVDMRMVVAAVVGTGRVKSDVLCGVNTVFPADVAAPGPADVAIVDAQQVVEQNFNKSKSPQPNPAANATLQFTVSGRQSPVCTVVITIGVAEREAMLVVTAVSAGLVIWCVVVACTVVVVEVVGVVAVDVGVEVTDLQPFVAQLVGQYLFMLDPRPGNSSPQFNPICSKA